MAQAEDYQVADAVAATITAASLSITPSNVARVYVPVFNTPDLPDGVNVYVIPRGIAVERGGKARWEYIITTHVGCVRRHRDTTNAVVDPLRDYSEEIFRELRSTQYRGADTPDAMDVDFVRRTNVDVTYDAEQLDDNELYVSLMGLEWRALLS